MFSLHRISTLHLNFFTNHTSSALLLTLCFVCEHQHYFTSVDSVSMPDRSGHGGPWPWNNNNDARHRLRPYFPSRGPDNYHFNNHNGGGGQQHRPQQQQYPYNPSVNYFNNGDGQQHHHHHYHHPPPPPPEQQVLPNQVSKMRNCY